MLIRSTLLASLMLLASQPAHAAGFEKAVTLSGKYAGTGGAAAETTNGSQSLAYNPAGLVGHGDISLDYSPTWVNVDGSLVTTTRVDQSRPGVLPVGGGFASYGSGKWGVGIGAYVVGGSKAIFPNEDLTVIAKPYTTYTPTLETDLTITEYSLGGAYEVAPGFSFGAAWRITHVKGTLSTIQETTANTAFSHLVISDAKDTNYGGFRLGAMYEDQVNHNWGAGLSFRSSEKFDAIGNGTATLVVIPSPVNSVTTSAITSPHVGVTLPAEWSLGGHYDVNPTFKVVADVDFYKYSANDNVYVTGTTSTGTALPNIPLNWSDMWNWRLGFEYTGIAKTALRIGYVRTSQVTNSTDAKATIPPPGAGNTITLGGGYELAKALDFDLAFEYARESGDGSMSMPAAGATTHELLAGVTTNTKATAYGIHTGLTYKF
jgi:long-subunit fatty acid transport protein